MKLSIIAIALGFSCFAYGHPFLQDPDKSQNNECAFAKDFKLLEGIIRVNLFLVENTDDQSLESLLLGTVVDPEQRPAQQRINSFLRQELKSLLTPLVDSNSRSGPERTTREEVLAIMGGVDRLTETNATAMLQNRQDRIQQIFQIMTSIDESSQIRREVIHILRQALAACREIMAASCEKATARPTSEPTQNPSQNPTGNPTGNPTNNPTEYPTTRPYRTPFHPTLEDIDYSIWDMDYSSYDWERREESESLPGLSESE